LYSKQQAAQISKNFWTSFGQYMRPLVGAEGEEVNWLNYKTGIRHVYFRMDADKTRAGIAIELRHPDASAQQDFFTSLQNVKSILKQSTGEEWEWQLLQTDVKPGVRSVFELRSNIAPDDACQPFPFAEALYSSYNILFSTSTAIT
jgi:hypothetical protein